MNNLKTKQRIKILIALIFAFGIVGLGSPRVFVADTPQVQVEFIAFFRYMPERIYAFIQHPTDGDKQADLVEVAQIEQVEKKELDYKPVMSGVSAAEDPTTKEIIVKIDPGTKLEVRYITLDNGQVGRVYVPVK
jgi:hypothetical protein